MTVCFLGETPGISVFWGKKPGISVFWGKKPEISVFVRLKVTEIKFSERLVTEKVDELFWLDVWMKF